MDGGGGVEGGLVGDRFSRAGRNWNFYVPFSLPPTVPALLCSLGLGCKEYQGPDPADDAKRYWK